MSVEPSLFNTLDPSKFLLGSGFNLNNLLEESAALLASAKKSKNLEKTAELPITINSTSSMGQGNGIYEKISEIKKKIKTPVMSFRDTLNNFKIIAEKKNCEAAADGLSSNWKDPQDMDLLTTKECFLKREIQKQPVKSPVLFREKNRFFDLYYDKKSTSSSTNALVKRLDFKKTEFSLQPKKEINSNNLNNSIKKIRNDFSNLESLLFPKNLQEPTEIKKKLFNEEIYKESDEEKNKEEKSHIIVENKEEGFDNNEMSPTQFFKMFSSEPNMNNNVNTSAAASKDKVFLPPPKEVENATNWLDGYLGGPPGLFRKGDWPCSKCKNVNFGRRLICNRCGEEKPEEYVKESEEYWKEVKEERRKINNPGAKVAVRKRKIKKFEDLQREIEKELGKFKQIEDTEMNEKSEENSAINFLHPNPKANISGNKIGVDCSKDANFSNNNNNQACTNSDNFIYNSGEKKEEAFLSNWEKEIRDNFLALEAKSQGSNEKVDYGALYLEWEKKFEREGFSEKFSEDTMGDVGLSASVKKKREGSSYKKSVFESWKKDFQRRIEESMTVEKRGRYVFFL